MSMPEQPNPPGFMEELAVVPEEEEVDSKLAEFLRDLGLEKYIQVRYGGKGREGVGSGRGGKIEGEPDRNLSWQWIKYVSN